MDKTDEFELTIFDVGDITCGIRTSYIQEINKHIELTTVYNAPRYVRGVLNLRGQIVTVIDLRERFEIETARLNENMRIIIVRPDEERIGLLVDSIDDIVIADEKDIEPSAKNIRGIAENFFSGIYKRQDVLIAILNIEEILKCEVGISSI